MAHRRFGYDQDPDTFLIDFIVGMTLIDPIGSTTVYSHSWYELKERQIASKARSTNGGSSEYRLAGYRTTNAVTGIPQSSKMAV